jgi:hypothetical protein
MMSFLISVRNKTHFEKDLRNATMVMQWMVLGWLTDVKCHHIVKLTAKEIYQLFAGY